VLQLWGGTVQAKPIAKPAVAPHLVRDDGTGRHAYAIVPIGPQGTRGETSPSAQAAGFATIEWDSIAGADSYLILRDGLPVGEPLRVEGSIKRWTDRVEETTPKPPTTPQTAPPTVPPPTFGQ
jgi:hypothetical protein